MAKDTDTMPVPAPAGTGTRRRWLTRVYPNAGARSLRIALGEEKLVLGRDMSSPELDDSQMSRRHVEVTHAKELDLHRARDLGSKNGTYLDGRRIDAEYLRAGSVLKIGGSLFAYAEVAVSRGFKDLARIEEAESPARALAEVLADRAARSQSAVLVGGPSGSGKELLARRIHEQSGREGELVAVNCATLRGELVASELFGHKRGAFSGAHDDREGLFAAAKRGTLFLDELAELPLDQQPALLRALQERKIRPVGADRELAVDVRVVAATHRDLDELVAQGKFRADLLARIGAVRIELPGLERRREEILPLFATFLGVKLEELQLEVDAAEAMLIYRWPMNVRELEQAAANLRMSWSPGEVIDLPALPAAVQHAFAKAGAKDETQGGAPGREELIALLREHRGNVAAVAGALGRHRQQLYRWLSAQGIDPAEYRGPH